MKSYKNFIFLILCCIYLIVAADDDDDGPYKGKFLGKFKSYHHEVSGDVYVVDQFTLLITDFNYDGTGSDTFFWCGTTNLPGPLGFLVPDEYGKTNLLKKYLKKTFTLVLPENKKISEIKWFSIYDLNSQNNFADITIPDNFEAPIPQKGGSFSKRSHGVSSDSIEILDSKTILIPEFSYDGKGKNTFFWIGVGPQPNNKGSKIPDELGYLDPLRSYDKETIQLELPGEKTLFDIQWLSVFDLETNENFGSILIPNGLNVPPSLITVQPHIPSLPNCKQLHKDLKISWDVFGHAITFELSGRVQEDEYMSFGISGSQERSQMLQSDVVVAYIDGHRGYSTDYAISSLAPCVQVLGQNKGVCRDDVVGGLDDFQLHTFKRENGVNTITFRRSLISADAGDKEFPLDRDTFVVWAIGPLDSNKEPAFHDIYPKKDIIINFNASKPVNDCFSFTKSEIVVKETWNKAKIFDRTIRSFTAVLGPSGGKRGYQGITGHVSNGLVWYINGQMIPELWLRRGLTYSFNVFGGNNPHSPDNYHPLVITDEPRGGYDRLTESKQSEIRVMAGVEFTRRGRPKPTAAGPLCIGRHPADQDRRLDDNFATFKKYNRTLKYTCDSGDPAILVIKPNSSWPDTVYYNSFTHANMGWKIHIVDSYAIRSGANILQMKIFLPIFLILKLTNYF